jgi:superkiller protein 3
MGRCFLGLLLVCAACSRAPKLPELQKPDTSRFLPSIREPIEKAWAEAAAKPNDAAANGRLGMVLHAHEQHEAAEIAYQRAHLLDPKSFEWIYYLGVVQAAQGKNLEAARSYEQALKIKPNDQAALLRLADTELAAGEIARAKQHYERLGDAPAALYGLGRARAAQGETQAAVNAFERAASLFPPYGSAHFALAQAYRKLGDTARAEQHQQAYEQNKLTVPPGDALMAAVRDLNTAPLAQLREGVALEKAGRLEEAVAAHLKALDQDSSLTQAHINLISLYGRLNQPEKAAQHYQQAVALNPNLAETYYNYGVLLFGQGKLQQAKAAFAKAVELQPTHPDAHNNLGAILQQEGKLDEAASHFRKAVELKPDYRLAHFHLGRILANRGAYREAIEHLQKTIEPEDESTAAYLYALAATYARAGEREPAIRYGKAARDQAAARGQTQLLASIERDLAILQRAGKAQ